jgi:soluble lytic murein transglycosylase-like protein
VRARDRSPDRYNRYDGHIREAARLYQLPESFIRAVMRVESDFSPGVVSHAGAMGLMQLMPRTAASMGVRDPFDARQNILGGSRYLRILANKFNGDLVLTIAAYNAGEGAVMRHRGVPPYSETRRYVQNVLRYYYAFRSASPPAARR